MKAKEYAERYRQSKDKDRELVGICHDMLLEIRIIAEQRKCKLKISYKSVFDEVEQKWRAFIRLFPDDGIKEEGLRNYLLASAPELCDELGIQNKGGLNHDQRRIIVADKPH